jgi:predicted transcriptional regulator
VCNSAGFLRGVVTKTDIVNQISQCQGAGCIASTAVAMTHHVMSCRSGDLLEDLCQRMKSRSLKNIPYLD